MLVAPSPDAALERQLVALEEEIAAGRPVELAARGADRGLRLAALQKELVRQNLDGFLVPRADEFQGEYVPPRADRLAWLTGFTGSAGLALVLAGRAAIFIDGRYTLQVRDEVDGALYEYRHITDEPADAVRQTVEQLRRAGTLVIGLFVGGQGEIRYLRDIFGTDDTIGVEDIRHLPDRLGRILLRYARKY